MVKKLTAHGNSFALVIDRPILELLEVDPEQTPLNVVTDGKCLIISPVRNTDRRKKFLEAQERMHRKYGKMLKRLAD